MPIPNKNWAKANRSYVKRNVPEKKGIYELQSGGYLVYIGKAKNLRRRILEHLREKNPAKYRYKTAGLLSSHHKMEDKHLDRFEEKHGRLPAWNKNDTRS